MYANVCANIHTYKYTCVYLYVYVYVFVKTTVKYFNPVHQGDTLFTLLTSLSLVHGIGLGTGLKLSFQESLIPWS